MSVRSLLSAALGLVLAVGTPVLLAPAAHADPALPGSFNTVQTVRILDTRRGYGAPEAPIPSGGTLSFVADPGISGSPAAVVLNVTAVNPKGHGYLTVFPTGSPRPIASNLNFLAGQNVPNMVVVKLGTGGKVSVYNGSPGTVDVLADIHGYYSGGTPSADATTNVITPVRVLDTRIGLGAARQTVPGLSSITIPVAGRNGVPATAASAILNVVAVNPQAGGHLIVYPGSPAPLASNLNFERGINRANLGLFELAEDGTISIYNGSTQPVDIVADLSGYSLSGTPIVDGAFVPSTPYRAFDSRLSGGVPAGALTTSKISIFAPDDPTFSFFKAVVVDVVAVRPEAAGFLTTWTGDTPLPSVSNSNFRPGDNVAGSVVVPVAADGTISIFNGSYGNVNLVVDVTGFFINDPDSTPVAAGTTAARSRPALTAATLAQAIARLHARATAATAVSVTR